jgi:hypothetical protein
MVTSICWNDGEEDGGVAAYLGCWMGMKDMDGEKRE